MKETNEEQLLHLGKYLITLGNTRIHNNHTRQDTFRTHTAVYVEN